MDKVYCSECKNFKDGLYTPLGGMCLADENEVHKKIAGTYARRPRTELRYARSPRKINRKNNCKWFEVLSTC